MAKKKQEEASPGAPAWMATFSDLMNLLLCFFILLFSMSTVDAEKFQEVVASINATFSVLPGGGSAISEGVLISSGVSQLKDLSEYYTSMGMEEEEEGEEDAKSAKEELAEAGLAESEKMGEHIEAQLEGKNIADQVEVIPSEKYVTLRMNGAILFDSGRANLRQDALSLLSRLGDVMIEYDDHMIEILGHTDSVPIFSSQYEDNMILSLDRAHSVFEYLKNQKGFDPATLKSAGHGEFVPIASNGTEDGRAQNRRVEIRIYNSYFDYD